MAEDSNEQNGVEDEEATFEEGAGDALEMSPPKEAKYQQIVYGTKVDYISGYEIDGYEAVSRGVSRTIPTQCLATLLFRAVRGAVPHILSTVPQKIMCNSLFVVDLKKLPSETDIYFDGLGTWDQNCGKITNWFKYTSGEAVMLASSKDSWTKDARGEEGAVMFLRRTDRNVNCKAYTRVVVICKDFGLAAIQYYFKNAEEQTFEIASSQPKGVRASALYSTGRTTRSNAKRKAEGDEGGGDDGGEENGAVGRGTPLRLGIVSPAIVRPIRNDTVPTRNVVNNPHLPPIEDITAQTMLSYLKNHVVLERQERAEERKLRREELEERRRERNEDRQLRKDETDARKREKLEEMDMRKQELSLERAKLTLDQQRWEMDRKEKEMFLELLRKKLIHE